MMIKLDIQLVYDHNDGKIYLWRDDHVIAVFCDKPQVNKRYSNY